VKTKVQTASKVAPYKFDLYGNIVN